MHFLNDSEVEKTFVERAPLLQGKTGGDDGNSNSRNDFSHNDSHIDCQNDNREEINNNNNKINRPNNEDPYTHTHTPPPRNPYIQQDDAIIIRPIIGKTRIGGTGLVKGTVGSGGMATVYLVWNERLEVFRAVKMLTHDTLFDRFDTEIKISAKLRHPNIVEIYNVGEWNGMSYMEMEYIDGENLQQILGKRGRFPEAVCCAAAICITNALSYAHNLKFTLGDKSYCGIIHRDLKPANIMFSKHGEVKLTDFGIARPVQASLHTIGGNIVGTLHYLSPEQMEGKNIDLRSDIYSLGTLIYEMATGAKTFPQESMTELMRQRTANNFKKPSDYDFPINSALANIILRCLERNPKDRYPNTESLLEDLRKAHSSLSAHAPEKEIAFFYPEIITHAQTNISTPVSAPKTKMRITPAFRNLLKKAAAKKPVAFIASLSIAVLLLASYILISNMPKKPHKPESAIAAIDSKSGPVQKESADSAPGPETGPASAAIIPAEPELQAAAPGLKIAAEQKTIVPAQMPTAPAEPKITEDDLVKTAAAAINRKEWERAIRALERPAAMFKEKSNLRALLLFEAYVESKRFDRAQAILDTAARTNDAHYFLTAGKYWFYKGNHAKALEMLEGSLIRSSALRSRNVIFDDAMYYIATVRSERFKAAPTDANRLSALDGWRRVESAYAPRPDNPRLERAKREIAALN